MTDGSRRAEGAARRDGAVPAASRNGNDAGEGTGRGSGPVTPARLRRIMGELVTGVTIVAARDPATGGLCGLTANSVTSVSLEPPLILVCVDETSDTHACIERAEHFSVNILGAEQASLSRRFAGKDSTGKFEGVAYREEASGAPVLEDSLAWVDCRVWARYPGGDHTIFVGQVLAGDVVGGRPLAFFRGDYGTFDE